MRHLACLFQFFLFFQTGPPIADVCLLFLPPPESHWPHVEFGIPKISGDPLIKGKIKNQLFKQSCGEDIHFFLQENIPLISTLKWLFPRSPTHPPRIKDVLPDRRFPRVGNLPIGNKEVFNEMSCRLNIVIQFGRRQGNESSLSAGGEFSRQKGNFSIFIVHHRPLVFWSAQKDQNKHENGKS